MNIAVCCSSLKITKTIRYTRTSLTTRWVVIYINDIKKDMNKYVRVPMTPVEMAGMR